MTVPEIVAELRKLNHRELTIIGSHVGRMQTRILRKNLQEPLPEGATIASYDGLDDLVGCIDDLPEDAAANHDHYLYGTPKQW